MSPTFATLRSRIDAETTLAGLDKRQQQIDRHYDNRTITAEEYKRLDVRIMERRANLNR